MLRQSQQPQAQAPKSPAGETRSLSQRSLSLSKRPLEEANKAGGLASTGSATTYISAYTNNSAPLP